MPKWWNSQSSTTMNEEPVASRCSAALSTECGTRISGATLGMASGVMNMQHLTSTRAAATVTQRWQAPSTPLIKLIPSSLEPTASTWSNAGKGAASAGPVRMVWTPSMTCRSSSRVQ